MAPEKGKKEKKKKKKSKEKERKKKILIRSRGIACKSRVSITYSKAFCQHMIKSP